MASISQRPAPTGSEAIAWQSARTDQPGPLQAQFHTEGSRVAVQAQQYIVHGDNITQSVLAVYFDPFIYATLTETWNHSIGSNDRQHLLTLLPCADQAAFNTSNKQHASECLQDTRLDVLSRIGQWADATNEKCIFWLSGMAGTGKSTIARTIARKYDKEGRLGASFFFSRGIKDLGSAGKVFTTLARQLAELSPDLERYICEAVSKTSNIGSLGLQDHWERLIYQPLSKLKVGEFPKPLVLVVDALDECDGEDDVELFLQVIASARSLQPVQLRVLVTSRPEIPIRYGIQNVPKSSHQDFDLHEIEKDIVDHDLSNFCAHHLQLIRAKSGLPVGWPGKDSIESLVRKAGGLFIYTATACRFIGEDGRLAQSRLDLILQSSSASLPPEKKLDAIYNMILTHSIKAEHNEEEKTTLHSHFNNIVGSIVILFDTLSAQSLGKLLHIPVEQITQTLTHLHSILHVPNDDNGFIRLLHPSFRDFLLDRERCADPQFRIKKEHAHQQLFRYCIQAMRDLPLQRDICQLHLPGALSETVEKSRVDNHIPSEVQYACRYWVYHLQQCNLDVAILSDLQSFLQEYFLYWLEALALLGSMADGILMVKILDTICQVSSSTSRIILL
jgi:hypothetical protein